MPSLKAYVTGYSGLIVVQAFDDSNNLTNINSLQTNASQIVKVVAGSGNFTVQFMSSTSSNIPIGTTAADFQTVLEGLGSIGSGNVAVSGDLPYLVKFQGALADQIEPLFIVNTS